MDHRLKEVDMSKDNSGKEKIQIILPINTLTPISSRKLKKKKHCFRRKSLSMKE